MQSGLIRSGCRDIERWEAAKSWLVPGFAIVGGAAAVGGWIRRRTKVAALGVLDPTTP